MPDSYGVILGGSPPVPIDGVTAKLWLPSAVAGGTLPAQGTAEPGSSPVATAVSSSTFGADGGVLFTGIDPGKYYVSWTVGGITYWSERYVSSATVGQKYWTVNANGGLSLGYVTDQLSGASGLALAGNLRVTGADTTTPPAAVNAASGQTADIAQWLVNNVIKMQVSPGGNLTLAGTLVAKTLPATFGPVLAAQNYFSINTLGSIYHTYDLTDHRFLLSANGVAETLLGGALPANYAGGNLRLGDGAGRYNVLSTNRTNDAPGFDFFINSVSAASVYMRATALGINVVPVASLQVLAGATTQIGLIVDTPAAPTAKLQEWRVNGVAIASLSPAGALVLTGQASLAGLALTQRTLTANATLIATDVVIFGDASGGDFTVTLPAAAPGNQIYWIKQISATNHVTVSGGAAQIDGAASVILSANQSLTVISNGTNWLIV